MNCKICHTSHTRDELDEQRRCLESEAEDEP